MGSREGRLAELGQLDPGRGPQFSTLMVRTIRPVVGRSLLLPDRPLSSRLPRRLGPLQLTSFRWTLSHSGQARPTRPVFCCLHAPWAPLSLPGSGRSGCLGPCPGLTGDSEQAAAAPPPHGGVFVLALQTDTCGPEGAGLCGGAATFMGEMTAALNAHAAGASNASRSQKCGL